MLIRDKVGKQLSESLEKVKDKDFEIVKLETNEEFFNAIISKIKSEIEMLEINKSVDNLAELMELIDWLQIALGTSQIQDVIAHRTDRLGLYWDKYFIRDKKAL